MKKIICALMISVMLVTLLASCGAAKTTTVKVRFVTWKDLDKNNEEVIYETDISLTSSNPNMYNLVEAIKAKNEDVAPVYGEDEEGNITPAHAFFGKEEKDDNSSAKVTLYRWFIYPTVGDAAIDPNGNTVQDDEWNNVIADGTTYTFVYAWWKVDAD